MTATRALISIGTNSTRLLIRRGDETLVAASEGTRLGTGLTESGRLDPDAQERTLAVVRGYMEQVRETHASVDCIATSAMRRASDGDAFARAVAGLVGIEPRVITGDEEASYSFLGATRNFEGDEPIAVIDVGGGSTEIALDVPAQARERGTVAQTLSLEIGAVRLAERHRELMGARALAPDERAAHDRTARSDAAAILAPLAHVGAVRQLVAVGGTAFTAAAMVAQAPLRDGVRMTRSDHAALIDTLLAHDLTARRALPYIRPQRADILPAGLIVLDEACRLLGVDAVRVSVDDLLAGYLTSPAYRGIVVRSLSRDR